MKKYQQIKNDASFFAGYTYNKNIRYNGSSGGIITQVLLYLLDEKKIDGALITRLNGITPETFVAKTSEEILSAQGSVYMPVPFFQGLRKLMNENGKYAIVGIPCQFKFLQKFPELDNKIFLKIGLFCNHTPSFEGTKKLIKNENLEEKDIVYLKYRGLGRIGTTILKTKNEIVKKNYRDTWKILDLDKFYTENCKKCEDHLNHLSDFACGDAWLKEYANDTLGTSLIIQYSEKAKEILNKMKEKNIIFLEKIKFNKILQSQNYETFNNNG